MKEELQKARAEYKKMELRVKGVHPDPVKQFESWLRQYREVADSEFNAMHLSTIDAEGNPSSRVVLLKGIDGGGFEFYTNYESDKGRQIDAHPVVALNFYWPELERQVRVEGRAERLPAAESDHYFQQRPHGSQVGAWASPQSRPTSRAELEQRLEELSIRFPGEVPRPEYWGGYRVMPHRMEFWQGRPNRLHDRIEYRWHNDQWEIRRLAP